MNIRLAKNKFVRDVVKKLSIKAFMLGYSEGWVTGYHRKSEKEESKDQALTAILTELNIDRNMYASIGEDDKRKGLDLAIVVIKAHLSEPENS